jgi:glycine cleavage system aminomethyltransferase T
VSDNDVDKPPGSLIYTQFLNSRGGIEADLTITRLDEEHFRLVTGSGFITNDLAWLEMHRQPGDPAVQIKDISTQLSCLALWGPAARKVLEKVSQDDVSNAALPYLHASEIEIHGRPVLAARVSYAGELGWELYIPPQWSAQVWDALMEAGQEYEIEVGGYKALDSLRLEKGYKYFTADITSQEDPFSAGLGFCVKMDKGDFIGRSALEKIRQDGIQRRFHTLVLDQDDFLPIYGGEAVYFDGKVVSRVRSGGFGFTVKRNIAFAYLPLELAKSDPGLEIEIFGDGVPASVTRDVLWDPSGDRLRA